MESEPEWAPSSSEKPSKPTVETLPQFLERLDQAPPLGWHVPGLIPDEGICLWHGQPRDFKSMCAQEAGLGLAGGRTPFALGRFGVARAVRVVYFSEEDPERLFAARMRWLTARTGIPEIFFPVIRKSISFDSRDAQDEVIRAIQDRQAEVAFFKPLRSFTGQSDKGPADFAPVARFLRRIQDETSAKALVIPHHDTKPIATATPNPERSRSQLASGGGVFSISDCPVSFRKLDWNRVGVFPEDYKLTADPKPFEVEFQTEEWTDENGAKRFGSWVRPVATTKEEREVGAGVTRDKVLAFLESSPGKWFSTSEVEKGAGVRKSGTTRAALDELLTAKLIDYATKARAKTLGRSSNAELWTVSPVSPQAPPRERGQSLKCPPTPERGGHRLARFAE